MLVAVGSRNPVKIEAVRRVFSDFFGEIEVLGVNVKSRVPRQPLNEEVLIGAINRAREALDKTSADYGVGIEAGFFRRELVSSGYMDFQWCAILDREGFLTLGCGPGFEVPRRILDRVLSERSEFGDVMGSIVGVEDLGEKEGAIYHLTKGRLDRTRLTEISVLMALIPRLRRDLYL